MNEVELERLAKAHRTAEALVMDLREAIVTDDVAVELLVGELLRQAVDTSLVLRRLSTQREHHGED